MRNMIPGFLARAARIAARLAWRNEQGAVGAIVAMLLGFGVITGIGAMVIDVGQLYQNRAELQNGADAAALAIAKSCALGSCSTAAASSYADANAASRLEGIEQVCGSGTLGSCPASTGAITDCPTASSGANFVDVHTETQQANGSNLLPPVFGQALYGNSGYQGTTVYACGQAEWGAPATATAAPITVPACVWNTGTSSGASYAATPPTTPSASADMVLQLNGTSGSVSTSTSCAGSGTAITAPTGGESFNINPGDTFMVGYDFTIPGNNSSVTVSWTNLLATVNFTCPNGSSASFTISMPNYTVTVSDSNWYPSGNQSSSLVYQGSVTAPATCGAGQVMKMTKIATFSGNVSSTPSNIKINYRFHDEDNSSGSWSSTNSVTTTASTAPAVFSFTTDGGSCSTTFSSSYSSYGSGFPTDCEQALSTSQADHSVILIPVCATGCITSSSTYTLQGFAAFVVTGYNLPGFTASDWLKSADNCTGSEECIDGYFTQDVVPNAGTLGGQSMGADIIKLTG